MLSEKSPDPDQMVTLPLLATSWVFDPNNEPPVYTRPMIGSELALQVFSKNSDTDGEVCIGINFTSTLQVEELKVRARQALDKLRFVCPIIACTIEDNVSPRWIYTPSADREAWLDLAFAVEERGTSLDPSEFVQSIMLKRLPYTDKNGTTTFFRAYLLTTSEEMADGGREYGLYFHGTHTILDARPALHALNLMCEWMSNEGMDVEINSSEEWKNLPVDPITATGLQTVGPRILQVAAEQGIQSGHAMVPPSRALDMSDPPTRYTITTSESETMAIIAETKKLGLSISALFSAAHYLAQVKMNLVPKAEVDFWSASQLVALERYMKPPVDPRTHLISSFTMMPLRFSMAQILMEGEEKKRLIMTAKIIQDRFNSHLADPDLPPLLATLMSLGTLQATAYPLGAEDQSMPWFWSFNNLEVIENRLRTRHGNITVDSMSIGTRMRNHLVVHMWTMNSKFVFQAQGATALGEECIKSMLEEMRRIGSLVLNES